MVFLTLDIYLLVCAQRPKEGARWLLECSNYSLTLILYWLGWKPATSSNPPVSALPELGLQDCAGEPVSYLGAGIQVPVMAAQ